MSAHDDSTPKENTLDAFVLGVKIITGETNPNYFMESIHDAIWIKSGDSEIEENSNQGKFLKKLGFHYDAYYPSWVWYT